jgi:hypothetical protein
MTGLAVKSNGMPSTSAYSTLNRPFFVEVVGLAAKRAADDLFAEKLRAESAHAKNVGDVLASQPSVSMETETTQRMDSPSGRACRRCS